MQYALAILDAAHFRGNQLQHRPFCFDHLLQRREECCIDPVGDERANLPASEAFGTVFDDAQRVRRLQVLPRGTGGDCRLRQFPKAQTRDYFLGQPFVDVQKVRHHPRADRRLLDLAQLERQGVRDVRLLDRRLADEKAPLIFTASLHTTDWSPCFGSLGNSLVVEVEDLLAQVEVFERSLLAFSFGSLAGCLNACLWEGRQLVRKDSPLA